MYAVAMHLESASAEPEPLRSHLLGRRAPLHVRLPWAWRAFPAVLFSRATRMTTVLPSGLLRAPPEVHVSRIHRHHTFQRDWEPRHGQSIRRPPPRAATLM